MQITVIQCGLSSGLANRLASGDRIQQERIRDCQPAEAGQGSSVSQEELAVCTPAEAGEGFLLECPPPHLGTGYQPFYFRVPPTSSSSISIGTQTILLPETATGKVFLPTSTSMAESL